MNELKKEFYEFNELLKDIEKHGKKLLKYKGNLHYKRVFIVKIKSLEKKYLIIENKLSKQTNRKLISLFKKIKGSIETITEYKNPESTIEEINFIDNKIWTKIELELLEEDNLFEERIYDENSPFDFHNDIRDIIKLAKEEIVIVKPYIDEDILEITLRKVNNLIDIKILANIHNPKGKFVKVSNKFISQHQGKFEAKETDKIHDRGIFVDNKEGWVIGQSLKQGGKKPTYIIKLRNSKKLESIYNKIFLNSTKIK